MENSDLSRRKFIRNTLGTGLMVAGSGLLPSWATARSKSPKTNYDAKGLPTASSGQNRCTVFQGLHADWAAVSAALKKQMMPFAC